MSLKDYKFTSGEFIDQDIVSLSDRPNEDGMNARALKERFDNIGKQMLSLGKFNGLIDALTQGAAASEMGASSPDGVAADTVQDFLDWLYEQTVARYTKSETAALIGGETHDLVQSVTLDEATGDFTITKKDGDQTVLHTELKKVPATFEIVEHDGKYFLRVTNVDGSSSEVDVTELMNIYNFVSSGDISLSVESDGNVNTVTATLREHSVTTDKLGATVVTELEGYRDAAAQSAQAAASSRQAAQSYATGGTGTREGEDTDNAQYYQQEAGRQCAAAAQSASKAESFTHGGTGTRTGEDTDNAHYYFTQAEAKAAAADLSQKQADADARMAESYTHGGTGLRENEATDNAKYYKEQARAIAGGDFVTSVEAEATLVHKAGDTMTGSLTAAGLTAGNLTVGTRSDKLDIEPSGTALGTGNIAVGQCAVAQGVETIAAKGKRNTIVSQKLDATTGKLVLTLDSKVMGTVTGWTALLYWRGMFQACSTVVARDQNTLTLELTKTTGANEVVIFDPDNDGYNHAEGIYTRAVGWYSHAEGEMTAASGTAAHAEGYDTVASGGYSHAEGRQTKASNGYSHAEGDGTIARGECAHAEGAGTTASGMYAHAEGGDTTASGDISHAEGEGTVASGYGSHAAGSFTTASADYSFIVGRYGTTNEDTLFAVAAGTSQDAQSLAFEVTASGAVKANALTAGSLTVSGAGDVGAHLERTDNPHSVTAEQAGAVALSARGAANGVASLDANGKVPSAQLPPMDYDPAGSASAVDTKLTAHTGDATRHITAAERAAWNAKADKAAPFALGATAPADTDLLWIDSSLGGVIKYYDGAAWVAAKAVWG